MRERIVKATVDHQAIKSDFDELMLKHKDKKPEEILAIAALCVGMIIALQDQRTMTTERALQIVMRNIEVGNAEMIKKVLGKPEGNA